MKGTILLVASLVIQVQAASEELTVECRTCGTVPLRLLTRNQRRNYHHRYVEMETQVVGSCKQCRKDKVRKLTLSQLTLYCPTGDSL